MNYYKIVSHIPDIGKIIDTDKNFDKARIKRQKKLYNFFKIIDDYSQESLIPISKNY
jgi:hypothetical protein